MPEHRAQRCFGLVREIAVGWNVDLLCPIVANEKRADIGELLPDEGLTARQIERFDRTQLLGQPHELLVAEVVSLVEIAPVEAMLASEVADRVDEYDQKWRRLTAVVSPGSECQPCMALKSGAETHRLPRNLKRREGTVPSHYDVDSDCTSACRAGGNAKGYSKLRAGRGRRHRRIVTGGVNGERTRPAENRTLKK